MALFQTTHRIGGPRARDASMLAEAAARVVVEPVAKIASGGSIPDRVSKQAREMGLGALTRVAGNIYAAPASQDFWKVGSDGNLVRLVGSEVDLGESLSPADVHDPESHLASILADLEY